MSRDYLREKTFCKVCLIPPPVRSRTSRSVKINAPELQLFAKVFSSVICSVGDSILLTSKKKNLYDSTISFWPPPNRFSNCSVTFPSSYLSPLVAKVSPLSLRRTTSSLRQYRDSCAMIGLRLPSC